LYNQDTSSGNSVIKNDLEFTSHNCFNTSFDLWEEVSEHHLYVNLTPFAPFYTDKFNSFTILSCRKALNVGSALATRLGDQGAAAWYTQQSAALKSLLLDQGKFRFPDGSYRAYEGSPNNRRGVDSAVLLAILAAGDAGDADFGPTAPAVLASVKVYVDAFRGLYAIANSTGQREGSDPVPTGRYPGELLFTWHVCRGFEWGLGSAEDKWDGYNTDDHTMGNPWYICTVAVPHVSLMISV
jgi:glucoamylase